MADIKIEAKNEFLNKEGLRHYDEKIKGYINEKAPQGDWEQTDSTKADYIKNKPELGALAVKDEVAKADLAADVQVSLNKADTAIQSLNGYATESFVSLKVAENDLQVSDDDNGNVTFNSGAPVDNFVLAELVQSTGESKTAVMSQKATTDSIENTIDRIFVDGASAKTATSMVGVLEKATETKGAFYNGNGGFPEEISSWNYYTLQVKQGEKYRVCTFCVSNAYAVTIHKANGEIIAKYPEEPNGSIVDITFEIPDGASYIIANRQNSAQNLILETEGKKYDFSSALRNATIDNYTKEYNYVDMKDSATKGTDQFFSRHNGTMELDGWNTYELNVESGSTYRIKTAYASAAVMYAIVYADGNVSVYPTTEPTGEKTEEVLLNIPTNASKIIVNERPSTISAIIEKQSDDLHFKVLSDYLYGKKLVACGDSITEAINPNGGYFKNYAQIVAERHGMSCYVDGIGGTTMANIGDGRAFSENRYKNVPEFDYLTIWFGWNDGAYSELGTINDTDNTTFYGGYKTVLDYLITNNPTKKIGLIVPYGNKGLEPYAQAVRELSQMYGVPCLDLRDYNKCSLIWGTENNAQIARRAALTYDTTHPNQAGYDFLSTMYEQFLLSL